MPLSVSPSFTVWALLKSAVWRLAAGHLRVGVEVFVEGDVQAGASRASVIEETG